MTKKEIIKELEELGISHDSKDSKAKLETLLNSELAIIEYNLKDIEEAVAEVCDDEVVNHKEVLKNTLIELIEDSLSCADRLMKEDRGMALRLKAVKSKLNDSLRTLNR
jgi:hypothetical protein